jgi:hypothetical protein
MEFQWSDAWLLMAVSMCGKNSGDLAGIIGVGDMLNHAIFNLDELQDGFDRLINAGFVSHEDGRYRLTEAARPLFKQIRRRRLNMFEEVAALADLLQSMPCTLQQDENRVLISQEEYRNAVQKYQDSWNHARALGCLCLPVTLLVNLIR